MTFNNIDEILLNISKEPENLNHQSSLKSFLKDNNPKKINILEGITSGEEGEIFGNFEDIVIDEKSLLSIIEIVSEHNKDLSEESKVKHLGLRGHGINFDANLIKSITNSGINSLDLSSNNSLTKGSLNILIDSGITSLDLSRSSFLGFNTDDKKEILGKIANSDITTLNISNLEIDDSELGVLFPSKNLQNVIFEGSSSVSEECSKKLQYTMDRNILEQPKYKELREQGMKNILASAGIGLAIEEVASIVLGYLIPTEVQKLVTIVTQNKSIAPSKNHEHDWQKDRYENEQERSEAKDKHKKTSA